MITSLSKLYFVKGYLSMVVRVMVLSVFPDKYDVVQVGPVRLLYLECSIMIV